MKTLCVLVERTANASYNGDFLFESRPLFFSCLIQLPKINIVAPIMSNYNLVSITCINEF